MAVALVAVLGSAGALAQGGSGAHTSSAAPGPAPSASPTAIASPSALVPSPPQAVADHYAVTSLIWGIGEQHVVFFSDPRWKQMPLRHVRYFLPWDLRVEPRFRRFADRWLGTARRKHAIPLVALTQSNLRGRSHHLPSEREYRQEVGWIMSRYRFVREWTPWNEANLGYQATLSRPEVAARYWLAMRGLCRGCTVTSPSLVGYTHNPPPGWMRRFLRAARGLHGPWAVHLYNDINEFHPYALTQLMRQLPKGPIWVTEVGAWKHFKRFPTNLSRQTRAIRYLFQLAPRAKPRVVRWYLYQWFGSPRGFRWDSGLTNPNGTARPAMRIVQRNLLPLGVGPIR